MQRASAVNCNCQRYKSSKYLPHLGLNRSQRCKECTSSGLACCNSLLRTKRTRTLPCPVRSCGASPAPLEAQGVRGQSGGIRRGPAGCNAQGGAKRGIRACAARQTLRGGRCALRSRVCAGRAEHASRVLQRVSHQRRPVADPRIALSGEGGRGEAELDEGSIVSHAPQHKRRAAAPFRHCEHTGDLLPRRFACPDCFERADPGKQRA